MATTERWAELFEKVVGRKPTPQEFMQGKATDFSPKEIRRIAGLTESEQPAPLHEAKEAFIDVADQDFSAEQSEPFSQPVGAVEKTATSKTVADIPSQESDPDKARQDAWLSAFQRYVGRQPRPEEFLIGKAADFDLTSINQFLDNPTKPAKVPMAKWKKILIALVTLLVIAGASCIAYGAHYYSREQVASRYLKVAGKNFDKQVDYEVWSDTKKAIKTSELKYTDKTKVVTNTSKSDLMSGDNMVKAGREFLLFPKWKVAVNPVDVKISTNTKDLKIAINSVNYGTSDSSSYSKTLSHLYPGTYDFAASGKINGQDVEVSSQKEFKKNGSVTLNVKYLSFTLKSNLSDGEVYVGSKKIGSMKNGEYSANKLAVTDSASVYVQKKFSDGSTTKSETTSIEDIEDGDTLTLDADGILDRDTADDLITAAYNKLQSYAYDNTTPDDLDDVFQGGTENSMYKDVKDMIDTNTINAKNRKASSVTFSDVDVTSVTQTGAKTYTVNFTVVCDFYYSWDSDHRSSGDIKDKVAWSANVEYTGDDKSKSSSDDDDYDYDYDSYSDYIITGKNGESNNISHEDNVK